MFRKPSQRAGSVVEKVDFDRGMRSIVWPPLAEMEKNMALFGP